MKLKLVIPAVALVLCGSCSGANEEGLPTTEPFVSCASMYEFEGKVYLGSETFGDAKPTKGKRLGVAKAIHCAKADHTPDAVVFRLQGADPKTVVLTDDAMFLVAKDS